MRQIKRKFLKRKSQDRPCKTCAHPHISHYGLGSNCKFLECSCEKFVPNAERKYGNSTVNINGEKFDSKHEARSISDLRILIASGESDFHDLQRQVDFPLVVNGVKICTYRADAVVTIKDTGKKRIYEPKGYVTPVYRMKRKLMEAIYPDVELVEIY